MKIMTAGLLLLAAVAAGQVASPATSPRVSLDDLTLPQSMAFMLMRNLSTRPAAGDSHRIRREIEQWRIAAHDRKRKVTPRWLDPGDFANRRRSFLLALEEVAELASQARRNRGDEPQEQKQAERLRAQARAKLMQAGRDYADPLLRQFFMGAAALQSQDYRQAEQMFLRCRREAPYVAAFCQGHGRALLEVARELEAVGAFVAALRLAPDSSDALAELRDAMQATPGGLTKREQYLDALELTRRYEDERRRRRSSRRGTVWRLPGKELRSDELELPVPSYDRLLTRQAPAVPVSPDALIVDAETVTGALEVLVLIDGRYVPGEVKRLRDADVMSVELAQVRVAGYEFAPLAVCDEAPAPDSEVTVLAANAYAEMGGQVRRSPARVESADEGEGVKLSAALAAGEAVGFALDAEGRLIGVLASKSDVMAEDGGPDVFAPTAEMEHLGESRSSRSSRRDEDELPPTRVEGQCFLVLGVFGEVLDP